MMADLPHIASRVFGTPLLIARPKLDAILGVLGPRLAGNPLEPLDLGPATTTTFEVTAEGIAVILVTGTLVARSGYLAAASGLMSYADIGDAVDAAASDPLIKGIILDIDSPGGEVGGLFDLVDRIASVRTSSGKPLWAVADEAALSAAYAIASTADRIYVTQTGEVGSIGVVAVHVDESGADRQAGLAWSFVFAGARKVDGNPHEPLSSQARADIQADVDRLYARFVSLVANNRKLSPEAVQATEASVFRGDLAVQAGLADRVGTLRQALADMAGTFTSKSLPRGRAALQPRKEVTMSDPQPVEETGTPEPQPEPTPEPAPPAPSVQPAPPAPPVPPAPDPAAQMEQRLRAEYSEIAAVAAQAARLGIQLNAADAMAKGLKPDALRRSVLEELAARSDAADVVTATAPKSTGESPIVRRAKEAASRT